MICGIGFHLTAGCTRTRPHEAILVEVKVSEALGDWGRVGGGTKARSRVH